MRLLPVGADDFVWMAARSGYEPGGGAKGAKAVDGAGRILGMVIFDSWTPSSCHMHIAIEDPHCTPGLVRAALRYAFRFRRQVVGVLADHQHKLRRAALVCGFQPACRIPDGWDDGIDQTIYTLRRDDCRWIRRG